MIPDLDALRHLAEDEFFHIVLSTSILRNKLRVALIDGSYIDFWWSEEITGRYAYHWERSQIDGTIYRHDNIPHLPWRTVSSFPKHFHAGAQHTVIESDIPDGPEQGLRQFLQFVAGVINEERDRG